MQKHDTEPQLGKRLSSFLNRPFSVKIWCFSAQDTRQFIKDQILTEQNFKKDQGVDFIFAQDRACRGNARVLYWRKKPGLVKANVFFRMPPVPFCTKNKSTRSSFFRRPLGRSIWHPAKEPDLCAQSPVTGRNTEQRMYLDFMQQNENTKVNPQDSSMVPRNTDPVPVRPKKKMD